MNKKDIILLLAIAAVVFLLSGCTETSRKDAAERRWQRTIDQARIEAAETSFERGDVGYAKKILEDLSAESLQYENARQLLAKLESSQPRL